jgi:hypothetical protein
MAKTFTSWKQLEGYLKNVIEDCLDKEVANDVCESLQTAISDVVYASGEPKHYLRRKYSDGGLADKDTMKHTVSNMTLTVTPEAERNIKYSKYPGRGYDPSKSLAFNIVKGYGSEWYSQPRDFISETYKILEERKSHVDCMRDALKDRLGDSAVI